MDKIMQVVIDVPEDIYRRLKAGYTNAGNTFHNTALEAIGNGVVLPDGHGDLIDRNYFTDKYAGCGNVYCEAISCKDCNSRIVNKLDVDSAPTIIPAD